MVIDGCLPTTTRGDAGLYQAQANERNHNASHQRGDDLTRVGQQPAHRHLHHRGCHTTSEDVAQSQAHIHLAIYHAQHTGTNDGGDERERSALDAKQACADGTHTARLYERGYARHKKGHRHQKTRGLHIILQGRTDDERGRDDGHKDRQQVLQGGKTGLTKGRTVVQAVDKVLFLFHSHHFFSLISQLSNDSIMATLSQRMPSFSITSRPCWKAFSMIKPIPTRSAPA